MSALGSYLDDMDSEMSNRWSYLKLIKRTYPRLLEGQVPRSEGATCEPRSDACCKISRVVGLLEKWGSGIIKKNGDWQTCIVIFHKPCELFLSLVLTDSFRINFTLLYQPRSEFFILTVHAGRLQIGEYCTELSRTGRLTQPR
jgi:hypothetical protein